VKLIEPDWAAPPNVKAFFTCRSGGFSEGPYLSLNLGDHVNDDPTTVHMNRRLLPLPAEPNYFEQIHGNTCVHADAADLGEKADGAFTRRSKKVLVVLVADCLPVLFTDKAGTAAGAAHAGWRGLAHGILNQTVKALESESLIAWLGPCIGPCHYVVREDVVSRFASHLGFERLSSESWKMDLSLIARTQLNELGVEVYGGGLCTFCDEKLFYSYRRDGCTGRMGAYIWLE
jgi:hypothetical protein